MRRQPGATASLEWRHAVHHGPITIEVNGTQLVGRSNADSSPLAHWHYNVFDATTGDVDNLWLDNRLQFVSDFLGRVSGLQIVMEPAVPPVLCSQQPDAALPGGDTRARNKF